MDLAATLYIAKKILAALLTPPAAPALLGILGLGLLRARPRLGRVMAWAGLGTIVLTSLPGLVNPLLHRLEPPPLASADRRGAQAIVILGGGQRLVAPEWGGSTLNANSLERLRYGARLARQTGLPVLLSGGTPEGGVPEASLMAEALQQEFGVTPRWVEPQSLDTRQNALQSAALLSPLQVRRVLLVTDALHMRRSLREFQRVGLVPIAAPTGYRAHPLGGVREWLPQMRHAAAISQAWHEALGNLALTLQGVPDAPLHPGGQSPAP